MRLHLTARQTAMIIADCMVILCWNLELVFIHYAHPLTIAQQHPQTLGTFVVATPSSAASPSPSPIHIQQDAAPTAATVAAPAPGRAYGIAAGSNLPDLSDAALSQRLDGMHRLGVTWVRFDIDWSNIESQGRGQYNWSNYDRVAAAVVAHGLKPLGVLAYTPAWARPAGCQESDKCAPQDPTDYARFAGTAASHYAKLGISTWEIWNEPNISDYFKPAPNPGQYTALLRGAYGAIKAANPSAFVLTGGTAPAATDGTNIRATDFLRGVYAAGGHGAFDAVAHHPYTFPYTPDNAFPGGAWSDLTTLHNLMQTQGDGAKTVWATEYGAPTGGPGEMISNQAGPYPDSVYVSESLEAAMATAALARYSTYPWAGPLFWYTYQDSGTQATSIENFFGLLRADGSQKPAYQAFQNAIKR